MIVVSDTSPLTGLLTVGHEDLLPEFFGEVVIPMAVQQELLRFHSHLPTWLKVKAVREHERVAEYRRIVDEGEAEAIELAREIHANRLLIDDRKGRRLAVREGVPVIGLLGIVLLAKTQGRIPSARSLMKRLEEEAGMFFAPELVESALKSVGE